MNKYQVLRERGTKGANSGLGSEELIERLKVWDEEHGIEMSKFTEDGVTRPSGRGRGRLRRRHQVGQRYLGEEEDVHGFVSK